MVSQDITFDEVKALLESKYTLYYVDYRSNLDDDLDKVGETIRQQNYEPIDSLIEQWYEGNFYGLDSAFEELNDKLQNQFELDEDEAKEVVKKYEDEITELIYERDDSDILNDLLRNTHHSVAFYDTELYLPEPYSKEIVKQSLKDLKKTLKIKLTNTIYDNDLEDMIYEASCGGRVVVYFNPDKNDLKNLMYLNGMNCIKFRNPAIAIINTMNGSGSHTKLENFEFDLRINPENFFFDKEIKYSYTYDTCNMSSTWCSSTKISLIKKRYRKSQKSSSNLIFQLEQEKIYNETFQKGQCTFGDMKPSRHRKVFYQNTPPMCGTKCKDCGTFWID